MTGLVVVEVEKVTHVAGLDREVVVILDLVPVDQDQGPPQGRHLRDGQAVIKMMIENEIFSQSCADICK